MKLSALLLIGVGVILLGLGTAPGGWGATPPDIGAGLSALQVGYEIYQVRSGDTIENIAARYGVTPGSIRRVNGLSASSQLAPGQSLAVVMRGLVMREIPPTKRWAVVLKEARIGVVNGVVIGVITGLIAWLWAGNPTLGVVIGMAMIVNLLVAGFSGAAIPITLKSLGLDPAQSSSIVLTTITDVVGFFAFLSFALLLQDYLI